MLAERNRTPFDFAEGESELVSGFNVEYGGGGFALLFMAEYASILIIRLFFCGLFLGGVGDYVCFPTVLVVFLFI
jgi:NADH-ubiquinone oxidoreductase chain 1